MDVLTIPINEAVRASEIITICKSMLDKSLSNCNSPESFTIPELPAD